MENEKENVSVKEDKSAKFLRLFNNRSKKLLNQLKLLRQLGASTYRVDIDLAREFVKTLEEVELPNLKTALKLVPKPAKARKAASEQASETEAASDETSLETAPEADNSEEVTS